MLLLSLLAASCGTSHAVASAPSERPTTSDGTEETAAKIDAAVATLVRQAHDTALGLVSAHKDALDHMADQLLEHETISGDVVREIVGPLARPSREDSPGLEIGGD